MNFSENLKAIMKNNNISQYKMSHDTGISQSVISDWTRGKKEPSINSLRTICLYLHESADTLLEINLECNTNEAGGGAE